MTAPPAPPGPWVTRPRLLVLAFAVCAVLYVGLPHADGLPSLAGEGGPAPRARPPPIAPSPSPHPRDPAPRCIEYASAPTACVLRDAELAYAGAGAGGGGGELDLLLSEEASRDLKVLTSDDVAVPFNLTVNNDRTRPAFDVRHRSGGGGGGGGAAAAGAASGGRLFIFKEPYNIASFHNMGHLLADDIFPTFHLLHELALLDVPLADVVFVLPAQFKQEVAARGIVRDHFSLLTSNPVAFFDRPTSFATFDGGKPARFERLLFGWKYHGYAMMDRGNVVPSEAVVGEFRRRAVRVFGLEGRPPPPPRACSVLMVVKDANTALHLHTIANFDDVMRALREQTPCTVEQATWAGMPLASQVAAIVDKRIVIGLMGADLMNCIFQPLRSGIIVPEFCNEASCITSREVTLWYAHFPSRKVITIPARGHGVSWSGRTVTWDTASLVSTVLRLNEDLGWEP